MAIVPLVLVLGKGGVGRTTIARGLVDAAISNGHAATLVELATIGASSSSRGAVVLDPSAVVEDAATTVFGSRRLAHAVVGNFAIRRMLDVVPAIREYALLCAALAMSRTRDQVVVDMPATGHAVAWLGVASRLAMLVPAGAARTQAEQLDAALRDPRRTKIVVVALPEPLVLGETAELRASLRSELGRDADLLVMNRVPDVPDGALELARLAPGATQLVQWLDAREHVRAIARSATPPGIESVWIDALPGPGQIANALAESMSA